MKQSQKIILIAFVIVVSLISGMIYTTSLLKKESELNHLRNAKLHVTSFTDQVNQTINTVNRSIDNITFVLNNAELLEQRVKTILLENPFIRSISILDETDQVVYSSNPRNLNHTLDTDEYYPKPLFSNSILRFGEPIKGRDLFVEDDTLVITPMSKIVNKNQRSYNVVIAVSNDYLINKFSDTLYINSEKLEIIRIDGKMLFSSAKDFKIDHRVDETKLYKKSLDYATSSGIEKIEGIKNISAYRLTTTFPLCIAMKLDYETVMESWERKNLFAILFFSLSIIIIAFIIVKLLLEYTQVKNKEIAYKNKLILNQEKLKNAFIVYNNTNDGILITDENKNIIDVNRAFIVNTGYKKEEIYGKNPRVLKSDFHEQEFYTKMWTDIEEKKSWHGEIVNKAKNNQLYTELLTINKVCDKDGKIKNYIGIFTNITKEKKQESLLKEKEKFIIQQSKMASMGEMLENIAHQWRQPLSVISTAATGMMMEKEFGISKESVEVERLSLINDSAQFLSQTIDDFRNFFKPKKDQEKFYVEDAIDKSLNILSSKFKNRNIKIVKNINNIAIMGYESELIQVVMNIFNNARDVLESQNVDDRFIFIDVFTKDQDLVISIKDTGNGIKENILDKIFEPYFTTKHKSQGTGIGLYMSEEIIRTHMKGSLSVQNSTFDYKDKEYRGAAFSIVIPLNLD